MNRIKKARELRNISQKKLADQLNITQQAISRYEKGDRTPDKKTWEKISEILSVPPQYLTGETDDPDGWDLWEENTGYSVQEIKNEIERMKKANHIIGDPENLQNLIGQAVVNLSGNGNTDRGILNQIAHSINLLHSELKRKYEDPNKVAKLPKMGEISIRNATLKDTDLIYDDLSVEAYKRALDILIKARRDIQNISNDLKLN